MILLSQRKKTTAKKYQRPTDYFRDFHDWPKNWMEIDKDLIVGNALLTLFATFVESLIKQALAVKTIKIHMGNLAVLASEVIRRLNDGDQKNRKLTTINLLLKYIDAEQGPLVHFWDPSNCTDEALIRSFDATCKKLYKFILTLN